MQKSIIALLGLVAVASSLEVEPAHKREIKRNTFGAMEITDWLEDGFKKIVSYPFTKFERDYSSQAEFLKQATAMNKANADKIKSGEIYTCNARGDGPHKKTDPGVFLPVYMGELVSQGQVINYGEGICFKNISLQYNYNLGSDGTIDDMTVTIDAQNPKSLFCYEWMFFGNTEMRHIENIFTHGKHTITFKDLTADAKIDVLRNGVKGYLFCDGWVDSFISVFKWVMAFAGGTGLNPDLPIIGSHVPEYMIKENLVFFKENMNITFTERKTQEVALNESEIQSGDYFAVLRMDGLDPLVMLGTGSHSGHSVMALRFDGELYIVESQDGWYWPVHGIQRNKFSVWKQWAKNADFHVVHMPLSKENRAKFNETAAHEFFKKTVGLPYGYHNFLYGWIDTALESWPPLLPERLVPIAFEVIEKFDPTLVQTFFSAALNFRLGTKGLKIPDLAAKAAERNMSMSDLMAMVEKDYLPYTGEEPRDGWSYVCSSYVAAMWKAAGVVTADIQATEQTPKDIYQYKIFDTTGDHRSAGCIAQDPESPWCQILGRYKMVFPGWNSIVPYDHMNEKCPSVAPDYFRPEGC